MKNFLLGASLCPVALSWVLLGLRLAIGGMMLSHGWPKLMNFNQMSASFPDPLGVGHTLSLLLTVGAEVGCSLLLIGGFLTRPAMFVLIVNMAVAAFVIHKGTPFAEKELAVMYLVFYIGFFFTGAGQFSLDRLLFGRM